MKSKLVKLLLGLGTAAMLLTGCYRDEIAELHKQLDGLNLREMNVSIQQLQEFQSQYQPIINELSQYKSTIQADINRLEQLIAASDGKSADLERELGAYKARLEYVENALNEIGALDLDAKIKEINALIEAASKVDSRVAALELAITELAKTADVQIAIEAAIDSAKVELEANFFTALEKYKTNVINWFLDSDELAELLENYYDVETMDAKLALMSENAEAIAALRDTTADHRTEIDELKGKVSALEGDLVDIISEVIDSPEFEQALQGAFGQKISDLEDEVEKLWNTIGDLDDLSWDSDAESIVDALNELKGFIDDVTDPDGTFSTKIANLEKKVSSDSLVLAGALKDSVAKLRSELMGKIEALEALKGISLVYIPEFDDGKATLYVNPDEMSNAEITLNFKVYSEKTLKNEWFAAKEIKGYFVQTLTRASAGREVEPKSVSYSSGILTVTFAFDDFDDVFNVNGSASVAVTVSGIASSAYVPVFVQPYLTVDPKATTFYFSYSAGETETIEVKAAPGKVWTVDVPSRAHFNVSETGECTGDKTLTITSTGATTNHTENFTITMAETGISYTYTVKTQNNFFNFSSPSNRSMSVTGSSFNVPSTRAASTSFVLGSALTGQQITDEPTITVESAAQNWLTVTWDSNTNRVVVSVKNYNGRNWWFGREGSFTVSYGGREQTFTVTQYSWRDWDWD